VKIVNIEEATAAGSFVMRAVRALVSLATFLLRVRAGLRAYFAARD